MKSKFFGLSAKLALAVLAVGTMFTSCYDSENGDVTKPFVPAKPVYVVSGTITDFLTGQGINEAEVKVGDVSKKTDASGNYTLEVTAGADKAVSITKAGYQTVTRKLTVIELQTGMGSYTVSAALYKDNFIPGIVTKIVGSDKSEKTYDAKEDMAADLVNDTDEEMMVSREATVWTGAAFAVVGAGTKAASVDPAKELLVKFCKSFYGVDPSAGYKQMKQKFEFELPRQSSVEFLKFVTYGETVQFDFVYEGKAVSYTVNMYTGASCIPTVKSNSIYHGHGHGHGHGGDLNAGGGIFE